MYMIFYNRNIKNNLKEKMLNYSTINDIINPFILPKESKFHV